MSSTPKEVVIPGERTEYFDEQKGWSWSLYINLSAIDLSWSWSLYTYMVIVRILAMLTFIRWWQQLRTRCYCTCRNRKPVQVDKKIYEPCSKFSVDALKSLMKDRRLRVGGGKNGLIERFLACESRASDKQLIYIHDLMQKNHRLELLVTDIDSRSLASEWIEHAKRR